MKTHPKTRKTLLALAIAASTLASSGCNRETSANDPDDPDTSTPTDLLPLTQANFEGDAKDIGPRLHGVIAEVYRQLELLRSAVISFDAKMTASNSGDDALLVPFEACTNDGGIGTEFRDITNDGLSAGDEILRDFDNVGCPYDFIDASGNTIFVDASGNELRPRWIPTELTGSLLFTFSSNAVDEAADTYQGTATFGNLDPLSIENFSMADGLFTVTDSTSESFRGSVTFDINLATGNATFTDIDITFETGTTSLPGANITVETITRTLASGGRDSIEIVGGVVSSAQTQQSLTFETVDYDIDLGEITGSGDISGPTDELPDEGGIVFRGDNSAALMRVTNLGGGLRWGRMVLDSDNDGQFNDGVEAEASAWSWFIGGFLLPNVHFYPPED